jgi:hypothetical protein
MNLALHNLDKVRKAIAIDIGKCRERRVIGHRYNVAVLIEQVKRSLEVSVAGKHGSHPHIPSEPTRYHDILFFVAVQVSD